MENTVIDTPNQTLPEPVLKGQETLVINEIQIRSLDRSRKDIGDFKNIKISAESVYMPNRTRLYDLYKSVVEEDGHLSGIVNKRLSTVLNKAIHFQDKNGKRVKELDKLCKSKVFRKLKREILKTQLWGISGFEFIPGKKFSFKDLPRKHIKPKWGIISDEQNGITGTSYLDRPNLWVVGEADDLGLYLNCAPYVILKHGNLADWAQFIEIFGQPIRIAKYDAHDRQTKVELTEVLDNSGSSLALMIPKTADFEIMDGKGTNANGELQAKFHNALNDELDVCILGNTETTGNNNGGSNAKSKEQRKDQQEIIKSDIDYLIGTLNEELFQDILKTYGYPVEGGEFVLEDELDVDKVQKQVNVAVTIKGQGVPVSDDYFYQISGIPKPDNYDQLKADQEAQRAALTQPPPDQEPDPEEPPQPPNKRKGKKEPEKLSDLPRQDVSWIYRLRVALADFFDLPR